jgi:hypothetical protein
MPYPSSLPGCSVEQQLSAADEYMLAEAGRRADCARTVDDPP